jgi:hypothetical protein
VLLSLPLFPTPDWLKGSADNLSQKELPIKELLQDSLYYPACALDGDPVRTLNGNIHSFVYVDYGIPADLLKVALESGFRGYRILFTRQVQEHELVPHNWNPRLPLPRDGSPEYQYRRLNWNPFCLWTVFERLDQFDTTHGPQRFSLLYLSADGAAAFQAMYEGNQCRPLAVAVIQPGHLMFGGNWTDYTDPKGILGRSVIGNAAGRPDILLFGGYGRRKQYRSPCWPDYEQLVKFVEKSPFYKHGRQYGGSIGVWFRPSTFKAQEIYPR